MKLSTESALSEKHHAGLPLVLLALIYTAFLIAGGSKLSTAFAIPHASADKAVAYVAKYSWSIRWGSFCELASVIPLGIFISVTISRLRFLGVRAAGELIARCGSMAQR